MDDRELAEVLTDEMFLSELHAFLSHADRTRPQLRRLR
jgi:hypothetical protein